MDFQKMCQAAKNGVAGFFHRYKKRSEQHKGDDGIYEDEKEENAIDAKLNSGSRNKTPVVKRGFILACMAIGCAVVMYAYITGSENNIHQRKPVQQDIINAHQPAQINTKEPNYSALRDADQKKAAPQQTSDSHGATIPESKKPIPAVPKIPQTNSVSNIPEALLPNSKSGLPVSMPINREKTMEERYQSPIAFYTNGNKDNSSSIPSNGHGEISGRKSVSYTAPSEKVLQAGTLIPAMLFSGINTDTSGQVTATIQSNIYDTATGTNLLIPAGSQIIGKYDSGAAKNGRVALTFSIIVLPDGGSYSLGNDAIVAVDGAGYNGIKGKVHHHTDKALRGGIFASTIAALGSIAAGNTSNNSNTYSAGQLAMQGAMANVMNSASNIFDKAAGNVAETITIEPGYQFNLFVVEPISF